MSYLVDGNNVMGQRVGWHRDKAGARRRLLSELARLARAAGVSVEVVFDGAPEEHFPDGSSFKGVRVFYAERGSNADERIKRLVEASRERRTLKVVTSDRALAEYVRQCGARVVRSGEFRRRLDEEASESNARSEPDERSGVAASELGEWMSYFGVAPEDDEAEPPAEVRRESKRPALKPKKKKKR
ncbi:MAG TPA: NYN domain-containing protein [Pyrinomonadaceae bacterium]|nr:NYN domain-containing protein [Pyrinomonadaceae bacterium]